MSNNEAQEQPTASPLIGEIPRGVEVLLKKAAVDPEFRELLLQNPKNAAEKIDLDLDEAEKLMLRAVSKEQLAQIIEQTEVPVEHRRVLQKAETAHAILAALKGGYLPSSHYDQSSDASQHYVLRRASDPPGSISFGISPDDPTETR